MNYIKISLLLLVALACFTASLADASNEEFQEVRKETISSNDDKKARNELSPEVIAANEDEEMRASLLAILKRMKAMSKKERSELYPDDLSIVDDEEMRSAVSHMLASQGRNELADASLSANDDEEARMIWAKLMSFIAKQAMKKYARSNPSEDDEYERSKWSKLFSLMKSVAEGKLGRNELADVSLSANDDEETRMIWTKLMSFIAKQAMKKYARSNPSEEDEYERSKWSKLFSLMKSVAEGKLGRSELTDESFSANDNEEARKGWKSKLMSYLAKQAMKKYARSIPTENDEDERSKWSKLFSLIKKGIAEGKLGRSELTDESLSANDNEEARKGWKSKLMSYLAKKAMKKLSRFSSSENDEDERSKWSKLFSLIKKTFTEAALGRNELTYESLSANDDEEARKGWKKKLMSILAKQAMKKLARSSPTEKVVEAQSA